MIKWKLPYLFHQIKEITKDTKDCSIVIYQAVEDYHNQIGNVANMVLEELREHFGDLYHAEDETNVSHDTMEERFFIYSFIFVIKITEMNSWVWYIFLVHIKCFDMEICWKKSFY